MSQTITNAELQEAAGISASYASMILKGTRPCSVQLALKVYRATGYRIGPLFAASDDEIEVLAKYSGGEAAPTQGAGGGFASTSSPPDKSPSGDRLPFTGSAVA